MEGLHGKKRISRTTRSSNPNLLDLSNSIIMKDKNKKDADNCLNKKLKVPKNVEKNLQLKKYLATVPVPLSTLEQAPKVINVEDKMDKSKKKVKKNDLKQTVSESQTDVPKKKKGRQKVSPQIKSNKIVDKNEPSLLAFYKKYLADKANSSKDKESKLIKFDESNTNLQKIQRTPLQYHDVMTNRNPPCELPKKTETITKPSQQDHNADKLLFENTQNIDDKIFQEKNNSTLTEKNLSQHSDGHVEKIVLNKGSFLHSTGIENVEYNKDMLNPKSDSPGFSTENYSRDFLVNLDKKLDKFFQATKDNNELKQRKVTKSKYKKKRSLEYKKKNKKLKISEGILASSEHLMENFSQRLNNMEKQMVKSTTHVLTVQSPQFDPPAMISTQFQPSIMIPRPIQSPIPPQIVPQNYFSDYSHLNFPSAANPLAYYPRPQFHLFQNLLQRGPVMGYNQMFSGNI